MRIFPATLVEIVHGLHFLLDALVANVGSVATSIATQQDFRQSNRMNLADCNLICSTEHYQVHLVSQCDVVDRVMH